MLWVQIPLEVALIAFREKRADLGLVLCCVAVSIHMYMCMCFQYIHVHHEVYMIVHDCTV